ncbi:MAG TPA: hypothetical protein PLV31_03565 [Gammaproteobacteria bacterium]|nr:hypothetical protein [Gammaproteobacteria bacterium]
MGESKKWRMDYSDYSDPNKGLESIGQTIIHVILALIVLGAVYTFFAKTEWEPVLKSPVVKTNTVESKALGLFDGTEEESQSD